MCYKMAIHWTHYWCPLFILCPLGSMDNHLTAQWTLSLYKGAFTYDVSSRGGCFKMLTVAEKGGGMGV